MLRGLRGPDEPTTNQVQISIEAPDSGEARWSHIDLRAASSEVAGMMQIAGIKRIPVCE